MKHLIYLFALLFLFSSCSDKWLTERDLPWSTPGLKTESGEDYKFPRANKTTGKSLNVLDFGAQPDDPAFDNTESFQAAMEAAERGDEVYAPEGNWYFSTSAYFSKSYMAHIALKSGVNFRGAGLNDTIIISAFEENENRNYKTTVIAAVGQSDIVISDLSISSLTDDSELPDPDVSNVNNIVGTAPVYGIALDNNKPIETHGNIRVENVLIEKFQRMAIRIRLMRDVKVSDSFIRKATDLGGGGAGYGISIQGMGNGADLTGSNVDTLYNVVENCTIEGPWIRHGILIQYFAHNNLITGNRISNTLLDAIDLHGEDEYSNEISHNVINNTRRGAAIGIGNSGATHDAAGPYNYIHNNVINGGARGIDVLYGSPDTIIAENTIRNLPGEKATGIFLQNAPGTLIGGNSLENITGSLSWGIKALYSYNALEPEKGIPERLRIEGNKFSALYNGVYVETHSENFRFEDNDFQDMGEEEYLDNSSRFVLPPISNVVIPRSGDLYLPSDDNFITNENRSYPQTQPNMKFKASTFDIPYNRMIYMKFDLRETPSNRDNVYLKLSGKSKDGLATINIHGTTSYTDWKERSLTWESARFHKDQLAVISDPEGKLDHVTDFTFTTVGTEFNTYYIDVTDYIKSLDAPYVTLILSNEAVENMYCEIYSKEISSEDYRPGLLYSNN